MEFIGITSFIDLVADILKKIKLTRINLMGIEFSIDEKQGGIDERLAKIETAKQNLQEGLQAIEDLKKEAEKNKKEVEQALIRLTELKNNKSTLETEVQEIKKLIATDVNTFQKIANIPDKMQINKERLIGFFSGILASVIASGIVWIIIKLYTKFTT